MTCRRAGYWLQLSLDDRLDLRRRARLEEHLEGCPTCRDDLLLLGVVCQGAMGPEDAPDSAELTRAIMERVAELERRRAAVARRPAFAPAWADALLAGGLATLVTALFLVFQPGLRLALATPLARSLLPLERGADALAGTLAGWVAWVVWGAIGLSLAIYFAGSEVRTSWRRMLTTWLAR
jgi:hypothetical protein